MCINTPSSVLSHVYSCHAEVSHETEAGLMEKHWGCRSVALCWDPGRNPLMVIFEWLTVYCNEIQWYDASITPIHYIKVHFPVSTVKQLKQCEHQVLDKARQVLYIAQITHTLVIQRALQIKRLTLVWYSFFCYSEGVVGLVDPLDFWVFNSTQSNNFMVKYSTDIYFIPIRSNMNSKYG